MTHDEIRRRREYFRQLITSVQAAMRRGDWEAVVWWMDQAQTVLKSLTEESAECQPSP